MTKKNNQSKGKITEITKTQKWIPDKKKKRKNFTNFPILNSIENTKYPIIS